MVNVVPVEGPAHVVVTGRPEVLADVGLGQALLPSDEGGEEEHPVDVPAAVNPAFIQSVLPQGFIGFHQDGVVLPLL